MALTTAFCVNGNKATIPQTTTDGTVSYDQGFGSLYALPPEEGGKFIDRAQFNQLMYDISSQVIANTNAIATKANATAVVNLSGNQTINNIKTFSVPPVSATNPTANNQVANKAYVDTVGNTAVKLTGDQTIQGTKTFNNNIVSPNITAMQNNLNTIFSSTTSPVKFQKDVKIITVGTGGDFQTIQEAVQEARKYSSPVSIRLVSDIRIDQSISLIRVNGKHVSIRFDNFKIINSTSSALGFIFNNTFVADIVDLNLENVSLYLTVNSSVYLGESVNINCENINSDCIRADASSTVSIGSDTTCNVKHAAGRSSFTSLRGSNINISDGTTINDNSSSGNVLSVYRSLIYIASGVTINSTIPKANQVANTLTNNGIIFGVYSL